MLHDQPMPTRHRIRFTRLLLALAAISAGRAAAGEAQTARWTVTAGLGAATALDARDPAWGPGGAVSILRRTGRFGLGLEGGYLGFGTETTVISDFNNQPGWTSRTEIRRSFLHAGLVGRLDLGDGTVHPYLVAGGGPYVTRLHERGGVTDASGQPVPAYAFDFTGSDVKVGLTGGLGLEFARLGRNTALAAEARWHGILEIFEDGFGTVDFLSLGIAIRWRP